MSDDLLIRKVEVEPGYVVVYLEGGRKLRYPMTLIEPSDIAAVYVADGREAIELRLRSGDTLSLSLDMLVAHDRRPSEPRPS